MRANIPREVETEILLLSGRRCCLCYGLHSDLEPKKGQIAHLDRNAANPTVENLAFLCLHHHDEYDSRTSQSKGFTVEELRAYRKRLHTRVSDTVGAEQKLREFTDQMILEENVVRDAGDRILQCEHPIVAEQCCRRLRRIVAATNAFQQIVAQVPHEIEGEALDSLLIRERRRCLVTEDVPEDVYGIDGEIACDSDWVQMIELMIEEWARGALSHSQCRELVMELDDQCDLDLYFILFGVPQGILGTLGKRYFNSLIFEFGGRKT